MKKIVLIFVIMTSCNDAVNSSHENKFSQLDSELYNKILEYQEKYPVPQKIKFNKTELQPVENSFLYIYEVTFTKINLDTIVSITISPSGISNYYDKQNTQIQVNGIYKDKYLKETYIRDPLKLGKKIIKEYVINKSKIQKFYFDNDMHIDLIYDTYLYRFKNGQLVFYKTNKGNNK